MKTNRSARKVWKLRITLTCLAIAALVAIEFVVGASLATRFAQTSTCRTEGYQAPNVGLADLMAAMR